MLTWINLFALAPLQGYVYFEALVDEKTNHAIGWSARTNDASTSPYAYEIVYSDGVNEVRSTRGTFEHARWAVGGLANHFAGNAAAVMPMNTLLQFAKEGWILSENNSSSTNRYIVTRPAAQGHQPAVEQMLGAGPTIVEAIINAAQSA